VKIYRPCDIRGNVDADLTPQLFRSWGRALGRQIAPTEKFVVGGDVRATTPGFLAALIEGLSEADLDIVNVGFLPTPMIYYAKTRLQAAGCAIVTGAHHPAAINGLKWMIGERSPASDDVALLEKAAEADAQKAGATERCLAGGPARSRDLDVSFDYVACLQERFVEALGAELHVVLDPMSGSWAGKVRRYLNAIFPQSLFSTIHNAPMGDFDGRTPDCSLAGELQELCDAVYRERAHFGVAFDGDGDRIALIDNEGVALSVEETTWVLLQSLEAGLAGQRFVHDARLSERIVEAAGQFGAEPVVERSGCGHIRARMKQTDALFGVESGGHYCFRELGGGDDGLFTVCWLIAWLASQPTQTLAGLRRSCPTIFATPDLRIPLATDARLRVINEVRDQWSQFPQETSDGVRISTPSGWIVVGNSATESALVFRFEGIDWSALDHLVEQFCRSLPELGDELLRQYRAAMGIEDTSSSP
jgi:phosphomannomutase